MKRIRPFIGTDLVKVMTGIRRCGKSVMLELIKDELREHGVNESHDNFPKYVVSMDELDMSRDGIKHRNIRDFLIMDNWE